MAYFPAMRSFLTVAILAAALAGTQSTTAAQDLSFREMRWRDIGPTRAGRARALAGVPSQPNVFYAGFDNGGVWRSTDYGANWVPLFDAQSTGSIGAIAVAPSNPDVIYVGTGAGIIRPDLAIGDGMYKSTDNGRTGASRLRDSQMIAAIAVDPGSADRLFVAVLGHPRGPNAERGVFRSTGGGRTFAGAVQGHYTSANEVLLDPRNRMSSTRRSVAATELHRGRGFSNTGMGIFKSTDGGTTGQVSDGLPAPSCGEHRDRAGNRTCSTPPSRRCRPVGSANPLTARTGSGDSRAGAPPARAGHAATAHRRRRPADHFVDPGSNVVYTASTVMWRTTDSGLTAERRALAPGGDDYQRI